MRQQQPEARVTPGRCQVASKLPSASRLSPETHPIPLTFQVSLSFPVSISEAKWVTVSCISAQLM